MSYNFCNTNHGILASHSIWRGREHHRKQSIGCVVLSIRILNMNWPYPHSYPVYPLCYTGRHRTFVPLPGASSHTSLAVHMRPFKIYIFMFFRIIFTCRFWVPEQPHSSLLSQIQSPQSPIRHSFGHGSGRHSYCFSIISNTNETKLTSVSGGLTLASHLLLSTVTCFESHVTRRVRIPLEWLSSRHDCEQADHSPLSSDSNLSDICLIMLAMTYSELCSWESSRDYWEYSQRNTVYG